ncbi:MAG: histidine kinase dimerization/phospho-acceptor domain-containing protein [Pseudomonadota bacterium]
MSRAAVVDARGERAPSLKSDAEDDGAIQALAELSRQIAHDVRTPLNALLGFSSMLSQELFGPIGNERYREYADHIASSAHQTVQAAERTLALAALTPQFPSRSPKNFYNLESLVRDAISAAGGDVPAGTSYEICQSLEVWIEQKTFHQAMCHVLTGARHLGVADLRFITNAERPFVGMEIRITGAPIDDATATSPARACCHGNARIQFLFAQTLLRLSGALVQLGETSTSSWKFLIQLEASAQESFAMT